MPFCPYCGSDYDTRWDACPICGRKISAQLKKKIEAAPEGEWVRAKTIPWGKIVKLLAAVLVLAVLIAGIVWAFSDNGIFGNEQPTVPTEPDSTQGTESQPTDPTTIPTEPTTIPTEPTTVPTEPLPTDPPNTDPNPTDPVPGSPIVGTWSGEVNAAFLFNQKLEEEYEDMAKYLQVETFMVNVILQFSEDGVMTYYLDQESYIDAISASRDGWEEGIIKFIKRELGMTPENYEEMTGVSVSFMVRNVVNKLKAKDIEAATKSVVSYSYLEAENRLTLGNDMGEFKIELKQSALRFLEYTGKYDDDSLESIFTSTVFNKMG